MNPLKWFSKRTDKTDGNAAPLDGKEQEQAGFPRHPSASEPPGSSTPTATGSQRNQTPTNENSHAQVLRHLTAAMAASEEIPRSRFGTEPPTPVNQDRIARFLTAKEYKFTLDDNSNLFGIWDGNPFWFIFLGKDDTVFQIRSRWKREFNPDARRSVLYAVNDWNRDKIWPKSAIYVDDATRRLQVHAEVSFDFTAGASRPQLEYAFGYAMDTTMQFFEYMNTRVTPDWEDLPLD